MAELGIRCECGGISPQGTQFCVECGAFLRFGGNATAHIDPELAAEIVASAEDVRGAGVVAGPAPPGRVSVALREADGEYMVDGELRCRVVPGEQVRLVARIHNQTKLVDNLKLRVDGLPEDWWSIKPGTVYLTPREAGKQDYEQEVDVRLMPPRVPEATAGPRQLRVVAESQASKGRNASASLTLDIEPYSDLTVKLRTPKLRSRFRARTEVLVSNHGNGVAVVDLSAHEDTDKMGFKLTPEQVGVGYKDEATARLEVKAPRRTWIGQPKLRAFTVDAQAQDGSEAVSADGSLEHQPYARPWVLLAVPLVALAAAWYLSRPPQVVVPKLTGMTLLQASKALSEKKFEPDLKAIEPENPERPKSGVLVQKPEGGDKADEGSKVTVTYEQGTGKAAVPDLAGQTPAEAEETLADDFQLSEVLPADAPPEAKIVKQKPAEGVLWRLKGAVSVTVDPTTVPATGALKVALAYSNGKQIFVMEPGKGEKAIAGDQDSANRDPAWTDDGRVVYVHERSATKSEIRSVDPAAPESDKRLTDRDHNYGAPAVGPDGTMALIDGNGSGFGGRVCLMAPGGGKPTCWDDDDFNYGRPAWGSDTTLYALRRKVSDKSRKNWTELVRFTAEQPGGTAPDSWALDSAPVMEGDVLAVAARKDGALAVLTRKAIPDPYSITLLNPEGKPAGAQPPGLELCDLSLSGPDLVAVIGGCRATGESPQSIYKYDPGDLKAAGKQITRGRDPALAPAG